MQIQGINRTNPEKVFVVVRNDSAAAIGKGYPVVYKFDGTRDGLDVEDVNTGGAAKAHLLAGLLDASLPAGQYGLAQCYGVRTDAVVLKCGTATSKNAAIGDLLAIHSGVSALSGVAAGAVSAFLAGIVFGQTLASSAATATSTAIVFLRLM
jgi:hypothetical protein